jgi:AraC-like DNA-binding protein
MTHSPTTDELREAYGTDALSAFSVAGSREEGTGPRDRSFSHPTLLFSVEGSLDVEAGGERGRAERGVVLNVGAGPATVEPVGGEPYVYVGISYVAGHDGGAGPFGSLWSFAPEDYATLLARAQSLDELGGHPDLESRLNQIIGATAFIKGLFDDPRSQDAPEGLRRARAHIDAHYADPLTLDQLGSIAGLAPKRFSERFQQAFGQRPISYVIDRRLEHADELLAAGMLVKDVARMVGYEDQFYFSRIYKKYRGESPEAARARLQRPEAGRP